MSSLTWRKEREAREAWQTRVNEHRAMRVIMEQMLAWAMRQVYGDQLLAYPGPDASRGQQSVSRWMEINGIGQTYASFVNCDRKAEVLRFAMHHAGVFIPDEAVGEGRAVDLSKLGIVRELADALNNYGVEAVYDDLRQQAAMMVVNYHQLPEDQRGRENLQRTLPPFHQLGSQYAAIIDGVSEGLGVRVFIPGADSNTTVHELMTAVSQALDGKPAEV